MSGFKHTPTPWKLIVTDEGHALVMGSALLRGGSYEVQHRVEYEHDLAMDEHTTPQEAEQFQEAEANGLLMAASPDLLAAHEPDRGGPDFLNWIADRLVNVYGESPNTDFVIALRRRAAKAKLAIAMINPSFVSDNC